MGERYLTKSRFKLARECPTKLFYTAKTDLYPDTKGQDTFLLALANGGHQVGELAKHYYPGGIEVMSLGYTASLEATEKLLQQEHVVIYEAALRHNNLFVRVDVLVKRGDQIQLIEVKAKSAFGGDAAQFLNKKGHVEKGHIPYLEDIAFQKYVAAGIFGSGNVTASLMMPNKEAVCSTDGLNQKFRIVVDVDGRSRAVVSPTLTNADLSDQILVEIGVDHLVDRIWGGTATAQAPDLGFIEAIEEFAVHYVADEKIPAAIGAKCKKCEFRVKAVELQAGQKSGFNECWGKVLDETALSQPLILDIWNFRGEDRLIPQGRLRLVDVTDEDLKVKSVDVGLSTSERQLVQVEKTRSQETSSYVDQLGLAKEMGSWLFPLNFIDFETSTVAIPFHKGQRPYAQVAFQFSHHTLSVDGRVQHAGQYINAEPGEFPNYAFVRALKQALEVNQGTVFCYHHHENTVLVSILRQLCEDANPPADASELINFIQTLTHAKKGLLAPWSGARDMVDLLKVIKQFYYNPLTNGSNSLKHVLPAILNSSVRLRDKYSQPVYGTALMPSKNFENHSWLDSQAVADPYSSLPPVFENEDARKHQEFLVDDEIQQGGSALAAYNYLQFVDMKQQERLRIEKALLRYCELDTLAMVMVYEAFVEALEMSDD